MIGRRNILVGAAAFAVFGATRAPAEQPILTDDGLYKQPWFLESFLDLADDLEGARKEGKRFAIMWELRGCPYCKETHLVNFARPEISDYVKANFEVLQLNIIGSRKVTDFDGQELSEKAMAAKYGVRFTPTFQFFGEGPLKD
ncbi:MAG TPA: thioredoxin family protein, partial [Pseudolabrys sp.]|nr:thioredoxin family protein [Pseudolabrys sp.]